MRLIDFARLVKPGYDPDWYHSLIAEYLEAATSGDPAVPNVLISCPPGHGKTELTAVLLPAWLLAHDRSRQLISLAAGDSLAAISSRAVRSILRSSAFADFFGPVDFDKESESEWQLAGLDRPTMYSAGVGGSITGRRADVLLFDDLLKSMADAFSPTIREKTFETYRDCGESRLSPSGVVVGIGTRWHASDPHGTLLRRAAEDPLAKQFIYISLAATNDSGTDSFVLDTRTGEPTYLPPYRSLARISGHRYSFARPALDSRRADLGPTRWAALYQQSPIAGESQLFPADAWLYLESPPAAEDIVALASAWDCASKEGLANDYSANVVIGELRSGRLAVLDVYRAKMTFDKLLETVVTRRTLLQRQCSLPALTVVEDAGAGQELIPVLGRLGIPLLAARPVHSKFVRAEGITHLTRSGAVLLQRTAAWLAMFIKELAEFPAGTHDDIVDAFVHGLKLWADATDFKAPDPLALAVGSYTRPDPEAAEIEEMLLRASTSFAPDLDAIDGNYPALREIGGDEW